MKKLLIVLLAATAVTAAHAQYFQYLYGSTSTVENLYSGHNAYQGGNTGHCLTGHSDFVSAPFFDMMVQRTDINGSTTAGAPYFNNIYVLSDPATANYLTAITPRSIEFTNGSGFGTAGGYSDLASGSQGVYYLPLDPQGNPLPARGYLPNNAVYAGFSVRKVTESLQNNNELYILGQTIETSTGFLRVFIIKIDQAGNLIWSNIYDLNQNTTLNWESPYDIIESPNLNPNSGTFELMVVGAYYENTATPVWPDAFLLRVDYSNGAVINNVQRYDVNTGTQDIFTSIKASASTVVDANGWGYVIGGITDQNGDNDFWFLGIDQSGTAIAWSNMFDYNTNTGPSNNQDYCYDLIERFNTNGNYEYYLAGYTDNGYFGMSDMMVVKADQNGNGVGSGQFTYGDTDADMAYRIDQLNGFGSITDGLSVFGHSINASGYSLGGFDHYLVKAYFNGVTACNYYNIDPAQTAVPTNISSDPANTITDFYDLNLDAVANAVSENLICSASQLADGDNTKQHRAGKTTPSAVANIHVFPNPMQAGVSVIDVQLNTGAATISELKVVDLLGRVYHTSAIVGTAAKIKLPSLHAGTYMVLVKTGNNISKTMLMVK